MKKKYRVYVSYVHSLMSYIFGHIHHVNLRRCQFFGHVHQFQSYFFGHLDSVSSPLLYLTHFLYCFIVKPFYFEIKYF